jgi:hypothetical protein
MTRVPSSNELPTGRTTPVHRSQAAHSKAVSAAGELSAQPRGGSPAPEEAVAAGATTQGNAPDSTQGTAQSLGKGG